MRYRNEPAFQRSSSVSRLSETQSAAGVIWSVSIASSFLPGVFGSQKMSASPRIGAMTRPSVAGAAAPAEICSGRTPGSEARFGNLVHLRSSGSWPRGPVLRVMAPAPPLYVHALSAHDGGA